MERIAVISDIHGNACALKNFLDFINSRSAIDRIVNLGDSVQFGPNPAEVMDIITQDRRFVNILGNTDLNLLYPERFKRDEPAKLRLEWIAEQMGETRMSLLAKLPTSTIFPFADLSFLIAHTTLQNFQMLSMDDLVDLTLLDDADYVAVGHTHLQELSMQREEKALINPGSLGASLNKTLDFLLIERDQKQTCFQFQQIHYDISPLIADIKNKEVPYGRELISNWLDD